MGEPAPDRPVVVISAVKSGTWLLRKVITELTGLVPYEPAIGGHLPDYGNADAIRIPPGHFFSWHSYPTPEVRNRLRALDARLLFLTRNVYDMAISTYFHFVNEVDSEIGRGAGKSEFLRSFSAHEGIALTLTGFHEGQHFWPGIGQALSQAQGMLEFAQDYPLYITAFERLVWDRPGEIQRISNFIGLEVDQTQAQRVAQATSFDSMRQEAARTHGNVSHFRSGRSGQQSSLQPLHRVLMHNAIRDHAPLLPRLAAAHQLFELLYDSTAPFSLPLTLTGLGRERCGDLRQSDRASSAVASVGGWWSAHQQTSLPKDIEAIASVVFLERLAGCVADLTEAVVAIYGINDVADAIIDRLSGKAGTLLLSDSYKWQTYASSGYRGLAVVSPEQLCRAKPHALLVPVLNREWQAEILERLRPHLTDETELIYMGDRETVTYMRQTWTAQQEYLSRLLALTRLGDKPTVVFAANQVFYNQLRMSIALRQRGWRTISVLFQGGAGHQDPFFDATFRVELPAFLEKVEQMGRCVVHTQGWLNGYDLPVVIDRFIPPHIRHIVELMDVQSFFVSDERFRELLPAMREAWGADIERSHVRQLACERHLISYADGVIFPGGKGHQTQLLAAHERSSPRFVNFPTWPLRSFFAPPARVEAPAASEPWRLVFIGGIPPFGTRYPHEIFGDAQILSVLEQLLGAGFAVDVYNNPNLGGPNRLAERYPEYVALSARQPRLRFEPGFSPWEIALRVCDRHFGLMLYHFEGVQVGDQHFANIVPSKLFTYLEAGLPVLVSSRFTAVCELIEQHGFGLCIDPEQLPELPRVLASADYAQLRRNALAAREALAMDTRIDELITLYEGRYGD